MDLANITIEGLMLDDSFVNYSLAKDAVYSKKWESIIQEHPEQKEVFEEARNRIQLLYGGLDTAAIGEEIARVTSRMHQDRPRETSFLSLQQKKTSVEIRSVSHNRWMKVAVAACFCIVVGAGSYLFYRSVNRKEVNKVQQLALSSIVSPMGQRKQLVLADGTRVILNSSSRISIPDGYNQQNRTIYLEGDAWFEVAQQPSLPFKVISGHTTTIALGTGFRMSTHTVDGLPEVKLMQGSVKVEVPGIPSVVLQPGEKVKVAGDLQEMKKEPFDTQQLRRWVKGELSFKAIPLESALHQLEEWYGVKINLTSAGRRKMLISGQYINEPLDHVLQVICFSVGCKYEIQQNTVNIM